MTGNNNNNNSEKFNDAKTFDDLVMNGKNSKSSGDQPQKESYVFQFIVGFSVSMSLFSSAIALGWNAPSIPKLMDVDESPVLVSADESSWIVAFMKVGTIVAPIIGAWMMDKFGRKISLIIGTLPLIVAWILIGVAENVGTFYVARILIGISYGMAYTIIPMYLAEIASDKIRGAISIILTVMAKFGVLYAFAIGPYVSVRMMAWLSIIPPVIFLLSFLWMPESPYYLLGKNKHDQAEISLKRLRRRNDVSEELEQMELTVRAAEENKGTFNELFFTTGSRRSLIIILGLGAMQALCGSQSIIAYSTTIFERIGSNMGSSEITIILGVVQVISAAISSIFVDRLGRRPLLLASIIGVAICNTIVGVYFNLIRHEIDNISNISWLPVAAVMVLIIFYSIGMATVTLTLLGEIFPKNLKAIAGAIFTINWAVFSFAIAKLFQVVSDYMGSDYTFFGLAIFSYIFIPFVWFLIPETKGKSLDLILMEMNSKKL